MIRYTPIFAIFFALALPGGAKAAPFCAQITGIAPQCLFADPNSCQREADRQGGRCVANPEEFSTGGTGLPFCVVDAGNVASCVFMDRSACDQEARRKNGACVAATPPLSQPPVIDPYELKRPY